jgi:TRAP-type C4-dicarboxylate transport system permease small subunit
VVDALAVVAGALLCALVVLVCLDVATRTFRLFAMPWAPDFSEYALYGITFLGAPWVLREEGHIAIELLVERLTPGAQRAARRFASLLGAVVCAALLYYACRQLWRSYAAQNLVYETFVFPEWWQYVLPPPIFLLLLALFVRRFFARAA